MPAAEFAVVWAIHFLACFLPLHASNQPLLPATGISAIISLACTCYILRQKGPGRSWAAYFLADGPKLIRFFLILITVASVLVIALVMLFSPSPIVVRAPAGEGIPTLAEMHQIAAEMRREMAHSDLTHDARGKLTAYVDFVEGLSETPHP